MTAWHKLSPSRQTWTVYRIVRKLEPQAQLETIRDTLTKEVGVKMELRWCRTRLRIFTEQNILRSDVIDGQQRWFATGKHEANTQPEKPTVTE